MGLDIEVQGCPANYVVINIQRHANTTYNITQQLSSFYHTRCWSRGKPNQAPAKVTLHLHVFQSLPKFDLNFNDHSIIGKLNNVAKITVLISCMPLIRLPSTLLTHAKNMVKQCFTWSDISSTPRIQGTDLSQTQNKHLTVFVMQIFQAFGRSYLPLLIQILPSHDVVWLLFMCQW